jgi:3-deoxy-manno-octulosonate cytidylyltransferase (CMP-KDO synthetase)
MHVVGIIPARFGSSRFPGKPLIDLKGKSMIQRVYEGASKSDLISELIVATDDERIYAEVIRFGGKVVMTAATHQTGTDRCAEVVNQLENADVVINIQGDEPLVDYRQLNQLIEVFQSDEVKIATLASRKITFDDIQNPNRIKVVVDQNYRAIYFSRSSVPNATQLKEDALTFYPYLRHIGLYGFRTDVIKEITQLKPTLLEQTESLEQLRWMYYGYSIHVVETAIESPNIDIPEDVIKVLELL